MKHLQLTILCFLLFVDVSTFAQTDQVNNPKILKDFPSNFVSARDVYVSLPSGYNTEKAYPVLYMHDGQMLFSSIDTWNKQSWGISEVMDSLTTVNAIQDVIVVGIANIAEERHSNYFPQKPFLSLKKDLRDSLRNVGRGTHPLFHIDVNSEDYLKFIVYELKPFIDANYSTRPGVTDTFIAGSSMGGLISMYAFFEYPEVFGAAACLSTNWIGGFQDNNEIPSKFYQYISARKELINGRKLYFDFGTETLDQYYEPHQDRIDQIFKASNNKGRYLSQKFEGEAHTEIAWNKRLHVPLKFLLSSQE